MENEAANPSIARSPTGSDWLTLVGREIGDFEILREIGRGGMGTVFQARQKSLDRIVALKVLASGLATTPMSVLRFQREAQAAARLHHSNIIPIHALGDHEGIYYYAMELVHGENLHDVITRERTEGPQDRPVEKQAEPPLAETALVGRPVDPEATVAISPSAGSPRSSAASDSSVSGSRSGSAVERAALFETIARRIASVADALDYAHQHGVIHRDVKPHNLILSADGRVHVFDFGLARVLEQPGVTMTGEFIGSPLYMSPEQIMGGQVRVDRRTDIYSLGATLYEWLTLSPPFPGETREQVISKIITSELTHPRERNPHVPTDLETICLKCLEKHPDRRYQSAADMRDDLLRFVDHDAIRARRAGPLIRFHNYVLRHRVTAVAVLAVMVAGVLVAALIQQARKSSGKEKQIAQVHETVKAKDQIVEQQQDVIDRLQRMLTFGEDTGQKIRPDLAALPGIGQFLNPSTGRKPKVDPLVEPLFKSLLAWQRQQERRAPSAELGPVEGASQDLYVQALSAPDLAETERLSVDYVERSPGDARGVKLSATVCAGKGDFDCVMTHAATLIGGEPSKADGFLLAGVGKMLAGNPADGVNDLTHAVELAPDSTWPLTLRGFARSRSLDFVNAIRDLGAAVRLAPDNTLALLEKARISKYLGDLDSAIHTATRLIELEGNNPEIYVFRGDCYSEQPDYASAKADYGRAVELGDLAAAAKVYWATSQLENQAKDRGADKAKIEPSPASTEPTTREAGPPTNPQRGGSADAGKWDRLRLTARRMWGRRSDPTISGPRFTLLHSQLP